ncbi:MAG: Fur family transcriptional regulator [Anaerolineae bacterium]
MSHHQELLARVRAAGRRITPQRESVLAVIAESDRHLTAEEILKRVRKRYPYLVKSAVYRSLDLLTALELVTSTDLGQGRVEYELHEHPHHHHLICRGCGAVIQVDDKCFRTLEKGLLAGYGFKADLTHFAIFGRCEHCRE